MNNNYNNPVQFEFFSGQSKNPEKNKNFGNGFKCLTLSFENIIVLCIIFVMSLVLIYSLGVERGKKIVKASDAPLAESKALAKVATQETQGVLLPGEPVETDEVIQIETEAEVPEGFKPSPEENLIVDTTDKKFFTIQVASFKLEKNAQKEADKLKEIGYDIYVVPKGSYSIVCVGKFIERNQAIEFSGKLRNKYNDCLVRRL